MYERMALISGVCVALFILNSCRGDAIDGPQVSPNGDGTALDDGDTGNTGDSTDDAGAVDGGGSDAGNSGAGDSGNDTASVEGSVDAGSCGEQPFFDGCGEETIDGPQVSPNGDGTALDDSNPGNTADTGNNPGEATGSGSDAGNNGAGGPGNDPATEDGSVDPASCGEQPFFYTVAPMDDADYVSIQPLGAVNPPDHTFPTVHTYMMLTDNTRAVPVYAPGDVTITQIAVTNVYSITFSSCTEVYGYYDHVSTLADDMAAQLIPASICQWNFVPEGLTPYCVNIAVNAGTLLGYIGGPDSDGSAALDFGARDARVDATSFIDDRLATQNVVCPYDYYEPGAVKDLLMSKLQVLRTAEPICGTIDVDVPDTAMGRWFLAGTTAGNFDSESDHLALVPSNFDPDVGVLSVGNSTVGTKPYLFDFAFSGQARRHFADISADGKMYCFDDLRDGSDGFFAHATAGYLFLKMTSNTTLTLERMPEGSCPDSPDSLMFSTAAVDFER